MASNDNSNEATTGILLGGGTSGSTIMNRRKRPAEESTTSFSDDNTNKAVTMDNDNNKRSNDDTNDNNKDGGNDNTNLTRIVQYYNFQTCYGEHKRAVSSVHVAPSRLCKNKPNSILVASASADGTCKIWDLQSSIQQEYDYYHSNPNELSSTTPNTTTIGKRTSLVPITTCIGHSRGINEVKWNDTMPLLATASDDKTIRLWDAVTGDALVELRGHDNFVFCVDFASSSNLVVSGSFDETVKLWDIRTGQCVNTIPAHSDPVTAVSVIRDGTTIASSSHDGLIRIWDVATGECLKTIYAAGNPPVSSVKFSPNGKYLLANTLDSTIRLWPITLSGTNKCSKTFCDPNIALLRNVTTTTTTTTSTKSKKEQHNVTSNNNSASKKCYHVNTKYSIVSDFTCTGDIVTGSETGDVIIYNLQSRQQQQVLSRIHTDTVLAVSAHDTIPFFTTGAMTNDKKVEFYFVPGTN